MKYKLHTYNVQHAYLEELISLICLCELQIVHNNLIVIQKSFLYARKSLSH